MPLHHYDPGLACLSLRIFIAIYYSSRPNSVPVHTQLHPQFIHTRLAKSSHSSLGQTTRTGTGSLKARYSSFFQSIELLAHVMRVLATERYRLPVRRYILDQLFGTPNGNGNVSTSGSVNIPSGGDPSGVTGSGGIPMDVSTMRALQSEVRKLEMEARAYDDAQARLLRSTNASSGPQGPSNGNAETGKLPDTPATASSFSAAQSVAAGRTNTSPTHSPTIPTIQEVPSTATNTAGKSGAPPSRAQTLTATTTAPNAIAAEQTNAGAKKTTGGSVLAKYAPVRKPQAPVGVARFSGFDA